MKNSSLVLILFLTAFLTACCMSQVAPQPQSASPARVYRNANFFVNFDQTPVGLVDDKFASSGVIFKNFLSQNLTANDQILVPSKPNYILMDDAKAKVRMEAFVTFVSPDNPKLPAVTSFVSLNLVGVRNDGGFFNGFTATALDRAGKVLDKFTSPPVGPNKGLDVTKVILKGPDIAKIVFSPIPNPTNIGGVTAGIDDVEIGPLSELLIP
jgi:hypothetical protein